MTPSNPSDTTRKLDAATYAITADTGEIGAQAELLCKSLSATCPDADIVTFVPTDSLPEMNEDIRDTLETQSTVVTGDIPIPDYPISALQQAMVEAAELGDSEYLVALDTDTVVLKPPEIPHERAELYARPATLADAYWTHPQSQPSWERLYEAHGESLPETTLCGAVDKNEILPFYNAGVVVTSNYDFPYEWIEVTRSTFDESIIPRGESFYNDQLALAVLAARYDTETLPKRENYPKSAMLTCPNDTSVLHYGRLYQLSLVTNRVVRSRLRDYGWESTTPSAFEVVARILIYTSFQSSRILSYETRQRLRSVARTVLPSRLVNLEG